MKASVIGGQTQFPSLTLNFQKENIVKYEEMKAAFWLLMLNDFQEPIRWLKPNKNGTKVNFDAIKTQLDYDNALAKLQVHIDNINKQYGTDLYVSKEG